jgi:hypothetical protein
MRAGASLDELARLLEQHGDATADERPERCNADGNREMKQI